MSDTECSIKILSHDRKITVKQGSGLLDSLMENGIFLRTDCGGKGRCNKCLVAKISQNTNAEKIKSCLHKVHKNMSIKIPESSILLAHVMDKSPLFFPEEFQKRCEKVAFKSAYGIAVDLGTTTIGIYLCNIESGDVVFSLSVKNPQALYGDDVISRIGHISLRPETLKKLQGLAVKIIERGIKQLLSSWDTGKKKLLNMVVVGNPTMIHIFAGVDPKSIGVSPYQPVFFNAKRFRTTQLGFGIQDIQIQILPQISGFIGGDILAAAVAVEFEKQPAGTLLIDLGTNGELVLKSKEGFYATSCATGPAFEGATLSCGIQAVPGAIHSLKISGDGGVADCSVIQPANSQIVSPSGICGPGVISAVRQFLEKQIIKPNGAFKFGRKKIIIVPEDPETGQIPIYISQKDIRSVQLGKSALMTGIEFLLNKAGLDRPKKIIIAGAFGSHLKKNDIIQLGMIPDIDLDKIEMAGNAAGSGAIMVLCDKRYIKKAIELAETLEIVDLASSVEFQEVFVKNLSFPNRENINDLN